MFLWASAPLGSSVCEVFSSVSSTSGLKREPAVICVSSVMEGDGGHERGWAMSPYEKEAYSKYLAHLVGCGRLKLLQICTWGGYAG